MTDSAAESDDFEQWKAELEDTLLSKQDPNPENTADDDFDPHEKWIEITGFSAYSVSSKGRIRNNTSGRILALTENQQGVVKVGLMSDETGKQEHRSVALLVAKHHLEQPPDGLVFDTPINLDGDRHNNRVENLMWRPRWFAIKYHKQFEEGQRVGFKTPIQSVATGEIFKDSMTAAKQYGILAEDTVKSVMHNTYVFPTFQKFRMVEER